ncbi:MAG TPA: HEAT repeat domain-containing protein [Polyangia bacterium]|jgi:HEAT repeat protein|nr:HEAT repeat domain-containing protein [Polyangia bacterium]
MASSSALVGKIRALLASQAHERQIAAAIVLGEIGAHDAAVIDALVAAAAGGVAPVQRHALEALARLAGGKSAPRVLPKLLPCLASRDDQVRRAAIDAAIAFGDDAVKPIRQRLADATDVIERRALEEVLGRVGGKDAFTALLAALDTTDVEAARAAALAVRQRVKDATPREKSGYLAQVTKLVRAKAKKKGANAALVAGGLKILGYLEDPAAAPTLLAFARDKRQPAPVREEAIVALRFTARGKAGARVAAALLELAEKAPAELARPALYTMASLELPNGLIPRLKKIALGAEAERALLAIERLAQIPTGPAADALAAVLTATPDRMRAEATANALGTRAEGAQAIARALLAARDAERAALLARLLRPRIRALLDSGPAGKKLAKAVLANALARIGAGEGADPLLPLAREIDREAAGSGLRALAGKLQKRKDGDAALAVLRLVGHATDATPDDGYALAAAELRAGRRDEALQIVQQLVERGFDVAAALRKDRHVSPEQRYQVGFILVERRHPAGEEILADLAGAGRNKIATMAKAKLKSAGYA